uniref:Uncharacterized protein n=1 Tax=Arundo donax TaxID=35708 RepID=A0A0A8YGP9_ARUDO
MPKSAAGFWLPGNQHPSVVSQ